MSDLCPRAEEFLRDVVRIRGEIDDPERAHAHEDELHEKVLEHISSGECPRPSQCAGIATQPGDFSFPRWCA